MKVHTKQQDESTNHVFFSELSPSLLLYNAIQYLIEADKNTFQVQMHLESSVIPVLSHNTFSTRDIFSSLLVVMNI